MPIQEPRFPMTEHARRVEAIYDRDLRPVLEPEHLGEFVLIDIETGAFEVDADETAATARLYARVPDAQPWTRRVGSPYSRRFGYRRSAERS